MRTRREADPEAYIDGRNEHLRMLDESDRRGTRGECDVEALVYGERAPDFDWSLPDQHATWTRPSAEADAAPATLLSTFALRFAPSTLQQSSQPVLVNACGCTFYAHGPMLKSCTAHLALV